MCFEFISCFGGGRKDDYGGERSSHGGCGGRGRGRRGDHGNRNGYNTATDQKPATAYDHQLALDEHGRKAHHDGGVKPDHASVVAAAGGHGYYAAYAPDKVHDAPKLPAWHNKVVDDAGYAHNTARLRHQAAPPDHREHAAVDYHHYPTTNTTLVRY
ncbi:hypothetical protein CFC21_039465 [Triticum aestivum]|uniref:Uncharacterized protein n=2 Tax=Triticum aestivum TaxID=4565 RepID=A0A3B6FF71_WHEAT|nr:uncharacterized protein LOC123064616 [Triticum aestivum]KAF7027422.1 hypothetical protein CFC21_039465 [Triticum aestivum]